MREEIAACSKRAAAVPISSSCPWILGLQQSGSNNARYPRQAQEKSRGGDRADKLATGCMERLTMLRF